MKVIPVLALALAVSSVAAAPLQQTQSIFVAVNGADGTPVRDLSPADLDLRIADTSVAVTGVVRASEPLSVVIVTDLGNTTMTQQVRDAMHSVVTSVREMNPGSRVGLMLDPGNQSPKMTSVADGTESLDKAINHFVMADDNSPLIEGIMVAAEALAKEPTSRRVVIAIAVRNTRNEAETVTPTRVLNKLRDSQASLWVVNALWPAGSRSLDEGRVLDVGTRSSGGAYYHVQVGELNDQIARLMHTVGGQYRVDYTAPAADVKSLRVGVRRDGAVVMAPAWMASK